MSLYIAHCNESFLDLELRGPVVQSWFRAYPGLIFNYWVSITLLENIQEGKRLIDLKFTNK